MVYLQPLYMHGGQYRTLREILYQLQWVSHVRVIATEITARHEGNYHPVRTSQGIQRTCMSDTHTSNNIHTHHVKSLGSWVVSYCIGDREEGWPWWEHSQVAGSNLHIPQMPLE